MIGFPPPLLGDQPVRLPVGRVGEGLLAIALPGDVLSEAHPLYAGRPSIIAGLQAQLRQGKPELERLGMEVALAVNFLEPETSGLLLVGITRAGVQQWRNAFGSSQLSFTYEFVALAGADLPEEITCDLPVARHKREERMLISHKTGKKSRTVFRRVATRGAYALWTAETTLPRMHQVRLHAMECGLRIPGEPLYGQEPPLTWAQLKGRDGKDEPIAARVLVHLARIAGGEGFTPVATPPEGRVGQLWAEFAPE